MLTIATNNEGKAREVREIIGDVVDIRTLAEAGIESDPEESGSTLAENAEIKARAAFEKLHAPVFADDTGLFIDTLDGAPGVLSARFAKVGERKRKVLELMRGKENRAAHFSTVICYIDESGDATFFEGRIDGKIAPEPRGENGFGYDSIFEVNGTTFAEMSDDMKNAVSHRYRALTALKEFLEN